MLKITITDSGFTQKLEGLVARIEDAKPAMQSIGEILISDTLAAFDAGGLPEPWQPIVGGGKPLQGSGRLRGSYDLETTPNSATVTWGSGLIYAAVQQFGATIKAKNVPHLKFRIGNRWASKKQVTIPARRYLRFRDPAVEKINELLGQYLINDTRGEI